MKKQYMWVVGLLVAGLVVAGCGAAPVAADCASEEVFCVGLVTDGGTIDDKSINQSAWEGVQQAEKELGAQIQAIETTDAKEYADHIASLGEQGYDVIVTVGAGLGEATVAATQTYPEVDFIGVDQFQAESVEGVAGLNFSEDQAGFLVGALAAVMSQSQTIGAVCSTDALPPVWRFGEGYKAGAAYADQLKGTPTEVMVVYHSNDAKASTDLEWGQATARTMLEQGADVIFGCGGTTGQGAVLAAAQADAYAIGADTDQYLSLPEAAPRMLSSALRHITPGVFDLIQFSREGSFPSGNYFGQVGYAPYHDLEGEVPAAVKTMMDQIQAGLRDGSIQTNVPPVGN